MSGSKKLFFGAALILGALAAVLLAGAASATQTGDTYGGSGTWTINNPTTLSSETVTVSGNIDIYNTFSVSSATITFTVPNAVITVRSPNGALTMTGSTVGTSNTTYFFSFIIQNSTTDTRIENTTLNYIQNGVQVTGGTAASRYFANVRVTHALNYGFQVTNSAATLFNIYVSLEMAAALTISESWSNQTYDYGSYAYIYSYHYIYRYWIASGTGVRISGGTPWVDGVETHVPEVNQRLDINLQGGFYGLYGFYRSYGCGVQDRYNITYTYDYFYPQINVNGFNATGARFAHFAGVTPPPENFTLDIHYTLSGNYGYEYYYCNVYPSYQYSYPEYVVYGFNQINFNPAPTYIGVYIRDGGLASLANLNYAMGSAGITLTDDWNGPQWAKDYFRQNYVIYTAPLIYSLWSVETVTTSIFAAITNTDFSLTNSYFSGAGVRVDRNYNYNTPSAPNDANATWFQGLVRVSNVTVVRALGTGVDIRLFGIASQTLPRYNYTALISGSTFSAGRAIALAMPNSQGSSNYTAQIAILGNQMSDGLYMPLTDLSGIITIDTGGHSSSLTSDWYQADVLIIGNSITNMSGPLVGFAYGYYRYPGGSSLTLESNSMENVSYYRTALAAGGFTPGKISDGFIKTNTDAVYMRNNSVNGLRFVNGILGGPQGADPNTEYLAYSYCAQYGYLNYGCSWPYKTPTIEVTGNIFEAVSQEQSASQYTAFLLIAGRGYAQFQNNIVNNSTVTFVQAFLNDYVYYKFPVEDINILVQDNVISNQSSKPFGVYVYPYKTGMPYAMWRNSYSDSRTPFIMFKFGWYSSITDPPAELGATFILRENRFTDLSLGGEAAAHLTGKMTIQNNTFEGVFGWAVIAEKMKAIPSISGNNVWNSTNGWWFAPAVTSGLVQTASFSDLALAVTDTGIRMENGNLVLLRVDFGDASTAVDMRNGYAEIYSSRIRVLSGRVQGDASITVYNNLGYEVRWADASGRDSGVVVQNALIVTSTPDNQILTSGHTDAAGRIAPKTIEIWSMVSFGATTTSRVTLPLNILVFAGGISALIQLPQLAPGESPSFFQDYDAYPVLLIDPVIPEISVGKPLAGETVGRSDVTVQGYTFERGSGVATQRLRLDGGAWINIAAGSATWSVLLAGVSEGRHVIDFEVVDVATNAFSSSVEFFVDVTPPVLTLGSPLDEFTLTNLPVFDIRGHVEPSDSAVALNGISIAVGARGDFFYNYTMADGLNILRFTATDAAGNQIVVVRQVEFDRYAPFLQVDDPVNGLLTNHRTVDVTGRSERGAVVTVNNLLAFVNPIDGTFVLPEVNLDDLFDQTENLLVIKAVDKAGNARYENRTVVVDTKAPTITLELDSKIQAKIDSKEPISSTSLTVNGRTDSRDAKMTIAGQDVQLTGLSFSRTIVMHEGLNVIKITARDLAGNTRELTLRVTRDTVRPTLTLETPGEPTILTNQTTQMITGYTDSPDATVYIVYTDSRDRQVTEPVLAVPVGLPIQYRFEYNLGLVPDGNAHIVQVRAVDLAENFDEKSFTYTAKVSAPFLEVTGFKTTTSDTFVWINGTTETGIDKVRINGQEFEVSSQFFAVRWNLPIQEGNYTFTVSVRDAAGNQAQYVNRVEVHATPPSTTPTATPPSFFSSPTFQVGLGAGLFGIALTVLALALARRRETE